MPGIYANQQPVTAEASVEKNADCQLETTV